MTEIVDEIVDEIVTKLPATACENEDHAFAGQCDAGCAQTVEWMRNPGGGDDRIYSDYLGGESFVDWSGCHRPPPRIVEVVDLDTINRAVIIRLVEED